MPEPTAIGADRELVLVARNLERLAAQVESRFDADAVEGGDHQAASSGEELLRYAHACLGVLEDPAVAARLRQAAAN